MLHPWHPTYPKGVAQKIKIKKIKKYKLKKFQKSNYESTAGRSWSKVGLLPTFQAEKCRFCAVLNA